MNLCAASFPISPFFALRHAGQTTLPARFLVRCSRFIFPEQVLWFILAPFFLGLQQIPRALGVLISSLAHKFSFLRVGTACLMFDPRARAAPLREMDLVLAPPGSFLSTRTWGSSVSREQKHLTSRFFACPLFCLVSARLATVGILVLHRAARIQCLPAGFCFLVVSQQAQQGFSFSFCLQRGQLCRSVPL
jgi:hypothetical protein